MKTSLVPLTTRGSLVLLVALIVLSASTLLSLSGRANFAGGQTHLSLKRSPKFLSLPPLPFKKRDGCGNPSQGQKACGACRPPVAFTTADSFSARAYHVQAGHEAINVSSAFLVAERTITEPTPGKEDEFMFNEIPKATQMVWEVPEGTDVNTALFTPFDGNEAISVGTSHLCGCTSLVIISQRGVYTTHYWENISFDPDDDFRLTVKGVKETNEQVFVRTVLTPLQNGASRRTVVSQEKLDPRKIGNAEGDNIRAFLVRPDGPANDQYVEDYRQKWSRIKSTVGGIVSLLDPNTEAGRARWQEVIYEPTDNQRVLANQANGRILIKYDPDHEGKKKVILWVERNKIYEHEWN
ncbi:hypothetical protein GE21DRAFT_9704 [Neurospora crassa]|uniref:Uncharacterized protein n=1 Tax=Neurospora crassa (strain ATCC 24698 / 74-OR23-1A / CBS 708.71 / DSM 1257 / FGSC 987) TaxID=367110 RepID=V5IKG0_NEUCR|nr:hypothetical protein NCU12051 [Neurospora crassa OR74A]ESA41812.1 hypothetical protein NCU12051 [Neurospora crassa OR74A]KHE86139.1 hypothetical protein GE21DRAFT_9704 [Neurospora crassa]|eukprot:XP_011395337.1 hypothetical protein NCU12051 [Neurospora crassa OR74A]